jgi:dihydropyrimidinase
MKTLLINGKVVTEKTAVFADVLIEGESITAIGKNISGSSDAKVIDVKDQWILPGGVDAHVHLDLPMFDTVSSDDHYTGTKAAAFGGTTTLIDFISQDSDDLAENFGKLKKKAESKATIDFGFHANITHLSPEVERQIPDLPELGVTSVKVFTAYNNRLRLQDGEIFRVMRITRDAGILTMLHAENGDLIELLIKEAIASGNKGPEWHALTRPAWGSVESVLRGSALAAVADAPLYIVHMNVSGEVDQLQYARSKGLKIMGETCPQYLLFTDERLSAEDGSKWVCSPPLRKDVDKKRLWQGLTENTIQTIATDHCPFFYNGQFPIEYEGKAVAIPGKELGVGDFTKIPNGLPGVGDRMPVLFTEMVSKGLFSEMDFVKLTCSNPAKIFGLYPKKGTIAVHSDADVVIWDPKQSINYGVRYSQQRTDYNLYEGFHLTGFPTMVYSRGELIVDHGTWLGKPGRGKYLSRRKFSEVI